MMEAKGPFRGYPLMASIGVVAAVGLPHRNQSGFARGR